MLVSSIKGRSCHAGRRSAGWPRAQSHSRPCIARSHTGAVLRRSGGRPTSPAGHQPEGDRGHLHRPRVSRGPSRRAARTPRGRSPGPYPRPRPRNRKVRINGFLNEVRWVPRTPPRRLFSVTQSIQEPREAADGTSSTGPPMIPGEGATLHIEPGGNNPHVAGTAQRDKPDRGSMPPGCYRAPTQNKSTEPHCWRDTDHK